MGMIDYAKISSIISIPYGAIKSERGIAKMQSRLEFQFLMVRLKVCEITRI